MDFMDTNSPGATVKQLQMVKCQSKICSLHTALRELLDKKKKKKRETVAGRIPTFISSLKHLRQCLNQATLARVVSLCREWASPPPCYVRRNHNVWSNQEWNCWQIWELLEFSDNHLPFISPFVFVTVCFKNRIFLLLALVCTSNIFIYIFYNQSSAWKWHVH